MLFHHHMPLCWRPQSGNHFPLPNTPFGVTFLVSGSMAIEVFYSVISGADPGIGQGGAQASEAESCRRSKAKSCEQSEQSAAGVQGLLKSPGSFWFFNAEICILTHSRDSFSLIFDIFFDTRS